LKYAAGKATIYDAALKEQREAIKGRLAAYRASYVAQIPLPPAPAAGVRSVSSISPANASRLLLK
jgi:hypothetical protein